ncbi:hypothetical protein C8R45DRAFT_1113771 [Mycena sanguinolenta]|nr:hypothetical protein C8R45DRAFT_1113771 [Mycena sanguinolenta]
MRFLKAPIPVPFSFEQRSMLLGFRRWMAYSGLEQLTVTCVGDMDEEESNRQAEEFFNNALPHHAQSLVGTFVPGPLRGSLELRHTQCWCAVSAAQARLPLHERELYVVIKIETDSEGRITGRVLICFIS